MKVGPVHVIRDATFRRLHALQNLWHQFSATLTSAAKTGNPLAERVLDHTHGLLHSPLCARLAASWVPDPAPAGPAGRAAAARVVAAYRKARADRAAPPAPGLWDGIAAGKRDFFAALARGDEAAVQADLDRMFASDLTWGLGQVHASHPGMLAGSPETFLHYRFTDVLVSLAEAVGAARVTAMLQDAPDHLQPLNRDLDSLYEAVVGRLGFDPTFPAVGGAYGFTVAGRPTTIDALTHAYVAYRLGRLGAAGPAATVYEIGGGYGCLALMARRAGVGRYVVFDLPWVNALQGYFLIRALPEGAVRLYGEESPPPAGGGLELLPYWKLYDEPAGSCDVLVNSDSLPEMGHATAAGYLPHVRRVVRRAFLSINQEAKAAVPGVGEQNCVRELVEAAGGFACRSRQRYWMRQGYVEEVFEPVFG
jgi:hypothetical protein